MDKIKEFFLGNREPNYTDRMPTQLLLTCRALVGAYLWYITYGLKDGIMNPESANMQLILILFSALFIIVGAILIYATVRNFMIGRYVGGKLDLGERPTEKEEKVIDTEATVVASSDEDTSDDTSKDA